MRSESGTTREQVGVANAQKRGALSQGRTGQATGPDARLRLHHGPDRGRHEPPLQPAPRIAWRHALGWPQWKVAQYYLTLHPEAKLGDNRVSEYEAWPHGGSPPSLGYLARLAATYGHGCTAAQLVDTDDLATLTPADRVLLTTGHPPAADTTEAVGSLLPATAADHGDLGGAFGRGSDDTGVVWGSR
ncbi:MAG: hypothetical protein ACRDTF_01630, partial [Pseudonocardiaceae bacterium]